MDMLGGELPLLEGYQGVITRVQYEGWRLYTVDLLRVVFRHVLLKQLSIPPGISPKVYSGVSLRVGGDGVAPPTPTRHHTVLRSGYSTGRAGSNAMTLP